MIASRIMRVLGTDEIHLVDTRTGLIKTMRFLEYLDTKNDAEAQNCRAFTSMTSATLESMRVLDKIAREN